ncbi:MAG: hypothetical protein ACW99A_15960 [Candidatus Kariarchaeaceae archaeon]|jgi:hypothetical protein
MNKLKWIGILFVLALIIWVSYYDLVFGAIVSLIAITVVATGYTHSDDKQEIASVQNVLLVSVQNAAGVEHSNIDPTGSLYEAGKLIQKHD